MGWRVSWVPVRIGPIGLKKMTRWLLRTRNRQRSPCPMVARGLPEPGRTSLTSSVMISRRVVCPDAAQACRAGRDQRRYRRMVCSDRGLRRGGVLLPLVMTAYQRLSSLRICSGKLATAVLNHLSTAGSRSSSSRPAAAHTSSNRKVLVPICCRSMMSVACRGAPGVSWRPRAMVTVRGGRLWSLSGSTRACWRGR